MILGVLFNTDNIYNQLTIGPEADKQQVNNNNNKCVYRPLACLLVLELQTRTNFDKNTQISTSNRTQQISSNKTEFSARENTWYIVGHAVGVTTK